MASDKKGAGPIRECSTHYVGATEITTRIGNVTVKVLE